MSQLIKAGLQGNVAGGHESPFTPNEFAVINVIVEIPEELIMVRPLLPSGAENSETVTHHDKSFQKPTTVRPCVPSVRWARASVQCALGLGHWSLLPGSFFFQEYSNVGAGRVRK